MTSPNGHHKLPDKLLNEVTALMSLMQYENRYLRRGQAFFNALYRISPDAANHIRATDLDPYYDDTRMPALIRFLLSEDCRMWWI